MIYNAMFPRNPQPETFADLMRSFKHTEDIHRFVTAQMVAGAKLALAWVRTHQPRIDLEGISQGFPSTMGKKGTRMTRHYEATVGPAERMINKLLEADAEFFTKFHYDDEIRELDNPRP